MAKGKGGFRNEEIRTRVVDNAKFAKDVAAAFRDLTKSPSAESQPKPEKDLKQFGDSDIWKGVFGLKSLLRWDVLGAIVPGIFIAVGIGMLTVDWFPHNLLISQISFSLAATLFLAKVIANAVEGDGTLLRRLIFPIAIGLATLFVLTPILLSIENHKHFTDPAKLSQVRFTRIQFFPTIFGQPQRVDVHYHNYGTETVKLRTLNSVVVTGLSVPLGLMSPENVVKMETDVWDKGITHPTYPNYRVDPNLSNTLPPSRDAWFSIIGPVIRENEAQGIATNSQQILIFTTLRLEWRIEGSDDEPYVYDYCGFITGDPQVIFNCGSHNGPVKRN